MNDSEMTLSSLSWRFAYIFFPIEHVYGISVGSWRIDQCVLCIFIALRHCRRFIESLTEYSFVDIGRVLLLSSVIESCGPSFLLLHFLSVAFASSYFLCVPPSLFIFFFATFASSLFCMSFYLIGDIYKVASGGVSSGDHSQERCNPLPFLVVQ